MIAKPDPATILLTLTLFSGNHLIADFGSHHLESAFKRAVMKVFPSKNARNDIVSITPEELGVQRVPSSLFSLLLDIESRLRKEARNNAQAQIRQCNTIFKAKSQKGPRVEKLSRYIE
jgi:hypothetical protein